MSIHFCQKLTAHRTIVSVCGVLSKRRSYFKLLFLLVLRVAFFIRYFPYISCCFFYIVSKRYNNFADIILSLPLLLFYQPLFLVQHNAVPTITCPNRFLFFIVVQITHHKEFKASRFHLGLSIFFFFIIFVLPPLSSRLSHRGFHVPPQPEKTRQLLSTYRWRAARQERV